MHNAWFTPEVRSPILEYLADSTATGNRRALAALARTCHTLSEPALDALWSALESLEPLLRCSRDKYSCYDYVVPPFNEEERNVMLRYAPRVRELTIRSFQNDDLSIQILQSLWFLTGTTPLLPNLRRLCWEHDTYGNFLLIRLLLSPSLLHLDVRLPMRRNSNFGLESFVLGFLECHTFCPMLKSIHFHHPDLHPSSLSPMAAISRAICRFPALEALTCHALSEEAFFHVANSRDIKELSARLLHLNTDNLRKLAEDSTLVRPLFENLRVFHLCVRNLSAITPYLKFPHQPFQEISIEFLEDSSPEEFHAFFSALCSPTRRQSLRRVEFRNCQPSSDRPRWAATQSAPSRRDNTSPVHFDNLVPLMGCSLRSFKVHLNNRILLSDNELVHLIQGWPDLETFSLGVTSGSFTLVGTLRLLARCPNLSRLKLCIDARVIPSLTPEESRMRNVVIRELGVTPQSPIGKKNIEGVAQFLLEHFPLLFSVFCPRQPEVSYPDIWGQVNRQIKKIKGLPVDDFCDGLGYIK